MSTAAPARSSQTQGAAQEDYRAIGRALTADDIKLLMRTLDPEERMLFLDALERRTEPTLTFRQYITRVRPDYLFAPHNEKLIRVLQDVADDLKLRVMVFMPPRHGKSELTSRLFPAYYLYRHGAREVGLTTYGAELSYELSRDAREYYREGGGELAGDSKAVKRWHVAEALGGGGLWATGAGGPLTGRGFHLGIIDDPYKDEAEAWSLKIRRSRWAWYKTAFSTRKAPNAAIIITLTRWHMEDIAGQLLAEEDGAPQYWHVVEMPAEQTKQRLEERAEHAGQRRRPAELDDPERAPGYKWPRTVTLEPDLRPASGDARWLWVDRFDPAAYAQTKREMGGENGYQWSALFQQRPIPKEGGLFKRAYFKKIPRANVPRGLELCAGWDTAATENDGDYTAGLLVGRERRQHDRYILGLVHGQWHPGNRDASIKTAAKGWGRAVHHRFQEEPGSAGKDQTNHLRKLLDGWAMSTERATQAKDIALGPAAAWAAGRGIYIVDEPWAETVIQELCDFGPASDVDDICDALARAHNWLARGEDDEELPGSHSIRSLR